MEDMLDVGLAKSYHPHMGPQVQSWCNQKFEGREDDLAKFFKQVGYKA